MLSMLNNIKPLVTMEGLAKKLENHTQFSLRIMELAQDLMTESETCYYAKADDLQKIAQRINQIAKETLHND